jgi:hypothetical protein
LVPALQTAIGLRGLLLVASGSAVLGYLLTLLLPEPARRTLEEVSGEDRPAELSDYRSIDVDPRETRDSQPVGSASS